MESAECPNPLIYKDEELKAIADRTQLPYDKVKAFYSNFESYNSLLKETNESNESAKLKLSTYFKSLTLKDHVQYVTKIYTIFDKSDDEPLNFSEFLVACDVLDSKENKENLKHIFKMFDIDNNDKLDKKEIATFVSFLSKFATFNDEKASAEFVEKLVDDLDTNKDGEITEIEFIEGVIKNEKLLSLLMKALLS